VRHAAERAPLHHGRGGRVPVDLHHVPERVEDVAVVPVRRARAHGAVPARVVVARAARVPALREGARTFRGAVAAERGDRARVGLEASRVVALRAVHVGRPVLLAAQHGPPRRRARAAVVHRAARPLRVGGEARHPERVPAERPAELRDGGAGDAPVEGRAAIDGESPILPSDLHDREPVRGDLPIDLHAGSAVPGGSTPRVERPGRDVLVVHHEQRPVRAARITPPPCGVERQELHAVVVVARAALEVGGGAVVGVLGRREVERIPEPIDDAHGVALRHGDHVGQALRHGGESEERRRGLRVLARGVGRGRVLGRGRLRRGARIRRARGGAGHVLVGARRHTHQGRGERGAPTEGHAARDPARGELVEVERGVGLGLFGSAHGRTVYGAREASTRHLHDDRRKARRRRGDGPRPRVTTRRRGDDDATRSATSSRRAVRSHETSAPREGPRGTLVFMDVRRSPLGGRLGLTLALLLGGEARATRRGADLVGDVVAAISSSCTSSAASSSSDTR
jgi:hypothetical protein